MMMTNIFLSNMLLKQASKIWLSGIRKLTIHQFILYLTVLYLLFSWCLVFLLSNIAVLDLMHKLSYVKVAWEPEFVEVGMTHLQKTDCYFIVL